MLSLCMIIKNGEKTLPVLLASIRDHFDEYVFVDTGSDDNTLKLLCDFQAWANDLSTGPTVKIEHFEWIDDFAAARNFAHSKATGDWVMYLDADDELINGDRLRAEVEATEKHQPEANAIMLPYIYMENDTEQEVIRIVKSSDQWYWNDEIHEHLECPFGRKRVIITGVIVKHHKDMQEGLHATGRNARIALKAYNNTNVPGKKARMAAYLATNFMVNKEYDEAAHFFREAINHYNGNPFAIFAAYEDFIRMELERKNHEAALTLASELAGRHPEWPEGPLALCAVLSQRGEHWRATIAWEESRRKPELQARPLETIWWTRGVCAVLAAKSYLAQNQVDNALKVLAAIPEGVQQHPAVSNSFIDVRAKATVKYGEECLQRYADFLLWTCEPVKALDIVRNPPEVLFASQALEMKGLEINQRLKHLETDYDYMQAYAAIPGEVYHTSAHHRDAVLNLARVRELLKWANQPSDTTRCVLAIGFQDGIIEQALLQAAPDVVLTVCDVAPQASQGFQELADKFPGRVFRHVMTSPMDFPKPTDGWFDLITAFEVIEHVRDANEFVFKLSQLLIRNGMLMLSTPVSSRWIENHLSDFNAVKHPYWHVRAFTHYTMANLLHEEMPDSTVDMIEAEDNTYVVKVKNKGYHNEEYPIIQIYVPSTPQPFDAESCERGFVGGSEEAVIRLSQALAKEGFKVIVYAPMPEREDHCKIRIASSVVWCDPDEFIPQEDAVVLYWRCPAVMTSKLVQSIRHTSVLWLHDAFYNTPAEAYNMANVVLTLSDAHTRSLRAHDGNILGIEKFSNGIVPEHFPLADESKRNANSVIYASSPERGLEFLLDHWDDVLEEVPNAELHIYYDWTAFRDGMPADYERMKRKLDNSHHSVVYHGGVSQPELHEAFRQASVWAYPNRGEVETFCITAVKAQACGCWPVATDAGALPEVISEQIDLFDENNLDNGAAVFVGKIVETLKNPPSIEQRVMLQRWAKETFSWDQAVQRLIDILGQ